MYLIVDNQGIHRIEKPQVLIGLAETGELAFNDRQMGDAACLLTDSLAGVELSQQGRIPILLNGERLSADRKYRIGSNDEIGVGRHTMQARILEPESRIARALRQRAYEIQSEIHHEILDRLRISNHQIADDKYRQQIEVEIDRQLSGAEAGQEIEEFLSAQALREMLMDRVNGYDQTGRKETSLARARKYEKLLAQLSAAIGLNEKEDLKSQSERVEVLLPWAMQLKKGLITQSDKRTLALGLLREQLIDLIFGLGPLEDLLKAPDISELMVNPSCDIYIEREGRLQHSGRRMPSAEVSRRIIERIVAREGRRIDQTSPMVDARLADGSRGNFVIEPVSIKGPAMTIRRFPSRRLTIENLIEKKTVSSAVANFLRAAVMAKKNIIISGGTGSGKTTLLNILAAWVSPDERVVTIEDTAEISLPQEHVISKQARPANLEEKGAITIRDLVRNALRMRPDRIIVGECRGGEALDMLQAMNTGHDGSLTTVHANAPWDAVRRLESLAMEAGVGLPTRAVREQIASALDLIVQVERFRGGARRITSVCEVVEFDEEEGAVILEEIYQLRRNRKKIRIAEEELEFTGYVPNFIEDLLATKSVALESLF